LMVTGSRITSEGLRHLKPLAHLHRLTIAVNETDDEERGPPSLRHVADLKGLTWLSFWAKGLSSSELRYLDGLDALTHLAFPSVDDEGALYLGSLTSLESLRIRDGVLTDVGLAHLSTLQNLTNVILSGHFTARGLKSLERLKSLTDVQIAS